MDNDVQGTEYCIGFSTAITRAKDAINRQRTTLGSHERIGVFRIFGRDAGFTALYTAYVTSARCLIPEYKFDLDHLVELLVEDKRKNPSQYSFAIAAEGAIWKGGEIAEYGPADSFGHKHKANVAEVLASEIQARSGEETLASELTYDLRSGDPDAVDSMVGHHLRQRGHEPHRRRRERPNGRDPRRQVQPLPAARPEPGAALDRHPHDVQHDRYRPIYTNRMGLPLLLGIPVPEDPSLCPGIDRSAAHQRFRRPRRRPGPSFVRHGMGADGRSFDNPGTGKARFTRDDLIVPTGPLNGRDLLRSNGLSGRGPDPVGSAGHRRQPGRLRGRAAGSATQGLDRPDRHPAVARARSRTCAWTASGPPSRSCSRGWRRSGCRARPSSIIGSSQKSVAARLAGMFKTPLGERRPQSAGYWLKTLHDLNKARIWWAPTADPELYEDTLIEQFQKSVGELPYAVLATPSGQRHEHGITSPLHDSEANRPVKVTKVTVLPDANEDEMAASSSPARGRGGTPRQGPPA